MSLKLNFCNFSKKGASEAADKEVNALQTADLHAIFKEIHANNLLHLT